MSRKGERRPRRGARDYAAKITFNLPRPGGRKRPLAKEGVLTDEDRTGKFIGRFGGAGQYPLSKD